MTNETLIDCELLDSIRQDYMDALVVINMGNLRPEDRARIDNITIRLSQINALQAKEKVTTREIPSSTLIQEMIGIYYSTELNDPCGDWQDEAMQRVLKLVREYDKPSEIYGNALSEAAYKKFSKRNAEEILPYLSGVLEGKYPMPDKLISPKCEKGDTPQEDREYNFIHECIMHQDEVIKYVSMLWKQYSLCEDDKLTENAIELKQKLLAAFPMQEQGEILDLGKTTWTCPDCCKNPCTCQFFNNQIEGGK